MPTKSSTAPTPGWPDPLAPLKPENASVFDSTTLQAMRILAGLLGMNDDPNAQLFGVAGAMEVPGEKLAMDAISRLARAKKMGFNTAEEVYHGSNKTFNEFKPRESYRNFEGGPAPVTSPAHFFSTSKDTAKEFALDRSLIDERLRKVGPGKPTVRSFYLKSENPLDLTISDATRKQMQKDGYSSMYNPDGISPYGAQELEHLTGRSFNTWADVHEALDDPNVIEALRDQGYDGVRLREESNGGDTLAMFDANQIRSTKAKFDPSKAGSGNILASLAALIAGRSATKDKQ